MSRFLQLRLLWRRAAARPGFTLVALVTLAVGIGANVAIFTVVNAVVLRPLPIPDSERLVMLRHAAPGLSQLDELPMSDALHFLYADESRTLDGVAAYRDGQASFTGPDDPQRVQAAFVTASFFEVMRTSPQLGRAFTPEDDRPGAAPVLVLADGLWRSRFGADPGVVGTVVDLDGASVEVVGVMPPGFTFSRPNADLWRPMALSRGRRAARRVRHERRRPHGRRLDPGAGAGGAGHHAVQSGRAPARPARGPGSHQRRPRARRGPRAGGGGRRHRGDVVDAARRGGVPAAHRVRQRGQPLPGAVRGAARRGGGSLRPRRGPRAARRLGLPRERRARSGRRPRVAAAGPAGGAPGRRLRPAGAAAARRGLGRRVGAAVRARGVRGGRPAVRGPAGVAGDGGGRGRQHHRRLARGHRGPGAANWPGGAWWWCRLPWP